MSILKRIEQRPPSDFQNRHSLREWWHNILRDYDKRYSCFAIFLVLPSDKETIRYLTEFGTELDIISGDNCLVIAIGKTEFRRSGFDERVQKPTSAELLANFLAEFRRSGFDERAQNPTTTERLANLLDEMWKTAIMEHVSKGYSVKIARLFNIAVDSFPCLLVFKDIRSPSHMLITLKGMTAEEIADRMRSIFSIIHKATTDKVDLLEALARNQNSETFRRAGKTILSKVTGFAEKTFETAMEAWISASIK